MRIGPRGVWRLTPVWPPAGALVQTVVRWLHETDGGPEAGTLTMAAMMSVPSLVVLAPRGLSGLLAGDGSDAWADAGPPGGGLRGMLEAADGGPAAQLARVPDLHADCGPQAGSAAGSALARVASRRGRALRRGWMNTRVGATEQEYGQ